jgi:short-subunit dehydrogenase
MARRSLLGLRTLVTGASSGIGRALVSELVRRGSRVVAMARRQERLAALAHELGCPSELALVAGDVTLPEDRRKALQQAVACFGGLDALVNNAGAGALGPFADASPERLRRIMEVNFFAPAEFIRAALPLLRRGRQPILVNVGSVLGHRAVPDKSEYCASKFALHGLSDALRCELAAEGIDVLLVSPSTTASEFFDVAEGHATRPQARCGAMTPQRVARRIAAAMAAGRREIILSWSGKALVWIDRLCPPLADWIVRH